VRLLPAILLVAVVAQTASAAERPPEPSPLAGEGRDERSESGVRGMPTDLECKGCRATVRLRRQDVERIAAEYLRDHPGALAAEAVYQERLARCRTCADLEYSTTCRHCGCLVDVRARLTDKRCPRPGHPAW
jgi:hypothetical protein